MKKNIFLNKKYLIKWTEKETAFLVQSPFNPDAGIWWAKNWYHPSPNWPDKYFSTGIVFEQEYEEITYSAKGIEHIKIIKGKDLYYKFQTMIASNKNKYLSMALATALKLRNLTEEQVVPQKFQTEHNTYQKLSW